MSSSTLVVQNDSHYLTWALRRVGTRNPVVIPADATVTFRAQHHMGGDPVEIEGVDEEPADWTIGVLAIRVTEDDILERLGTWSYTITVALSKGIEKSVACGFLDVVPRG